MWKRWKKRLVASFFIALLLGGLFWLRLYDPTPLQILRLNTFDFYQRLKPRELSPQWQEKSPVLIVDFDEKSLAEYGQFPWPRYLMARLVQRLTDSGISAMSFDIVFAEPDRTSPLKTVDALKTMNVDVPTDVAETFKAVDYDTLFAEAIKRSPVVLGQVAIPAATTLEGAAAGSSVTRQVGGEITDHLSQHPGLVVNLPIIEQATDYRGLLSLSHEIDGVVRRVPLVMNVVGVNKPAMSIELLRRHVKASELTVRMDISGIRSVSMRAGRKQTIIPTDGRAQVWVYYAEPDIINSPTNEGRMYISAGDILSGRVPDEKIAGRMAIFGTSAAGLLDLRNTPIRANLPGVEVHANIIENILSTTYLHYPTYMKFTEVLLLMVGALIAFVLLMVASPWVALSSFLLIVLLYAYGSWWMFTEKRILMDASYPLLSLLLINMIATFWRFRQNALEKQQVRSAFGQYLSPALVEQLANDPSLLRLGGERREMTILFCDVRGFTSISERFKNDPEGLTSLINRLLTPLTSVIMQNQGTVDKYMGDCIMAFWNAPLMQEDHAALAVKSAAEMQLALIDFNRTLIEEAEDNQDVKTVKIGIGLNSGSVVVGNMGSDQRFDYSVLGDAVNLAARLEGQSKSYGVLTVIGEDCYVLLSAEEQQKFIEIDDITVKGKQQAVKIYTPTGLSPEQDSQDLHQRHQQFRAAYLSQDWSNAEKFVHSLGQDYPFLQEYYAIMRERVIDYRNNPPPKDWDGVYVAMTK